MNRLSYVDLPRMLESMAGVEAALQKIAVWIQETLAPILAEVDVVDVATGYRQRRSYPRKHGQWWIK